MSDAGGGRHYPDSAEDEAAAIVAAEENRLAALLVAGAYPEPDGQDCRAPHCPPSAYTDCEWPRCAAPDGEP